MFYKDKIVLVTGGTGLVGLYIVQELLKRGARVRIPIHERPLVIRDQQIETLQADLTNMEDCLAVVKGVDYVFHAAGVVGSAGASPSDLMAGLVTNLTLAARILQAAWIENVDRLLLPVSSTVYPLANYPVKEEDAWSGPPHPAYFGYGWMKRYMEKLAEFVVTQSKLKIALVRPTSVYGRWDNSNHVVPALVQKAVKKQNPFEVWGSGEEIRDFLHASDLARGCLLALEKYAVCDPVNLGYGKAVKIKEVVQFILKAAGHKNAEVRFDISKPTTIPFRMVDISKAKKLLDFKPEVSIEEGLRDTVEWVARRRNTKEEMNRSHPKTALGSEIGDFQPKQGSRRRAYLTTERYVRGG